MDAGANCIDKDIIFYFGHNKMAETIEETMVINTCGPLKKQTIV